MSEPVRRGVVGAGAIVLRGILPHARRVIEVIEAAYCSAESGEAQELRSSFEPATG